MFCLGVYCYFDVWESIVTLMLEVCFIFDAGESIVTLMLSLL